MRRAAFRNLAVTASLVFGGCASPGRSKPPSVAGDASGSQACLPAPQVTDGPFSFGIVVFFDQHDARLTLRARDTLDLYKAYAATAGIDAVRIEGHVDASEDGGPDRELDKARAQAVAGYVGTRVSIAPLEDRAPLVPTPPGTAEPQNRFVQIVPTGYLKLAKRDGRPLLCRRWLLAHCIGAAADADVKACTAAVDFLVRGDDTGVDLDWRTKFAP